MKTKNKENWVLNSRREKYIAEIKPTFYRRMYLTDASVIYFDGFIINEKKIKNCFIVFNY